MDCIDATSSTGISTIDLVLDAYTQVHEFKEGTTAKTWIEHNTKGPYLVQRKPSQSALLVLSGLSDGKLDIRGQASAAADLGAYCTAAEKLIAKGLASVGFDSLNVAAALSSLDAFAVAEVCEFAEANELVFKLYILGVHSISSGTAFQTEAVASLTKTFGLCRPTIIPDCTQLRRHLHRSSVLDPSGTDITTIRCTAVAPSAPHLSTITFNNEVEEPFMMYRAWHLATKQMLRHQPVQITTHKRVTVRYLSFAQKFFRNKADFSVQYLNDRGVRKVQELFLAECGMTSAQMIDAEPKDETDDEMVLNMDITSTGSSNLIDAEPPKTKYILVPIATLGCGKTTIALALTKLLGWGHVQNDDIPKRGGGAGLRFCEAVKSSLASRQVVFADRNNHMKREREQFMTDMRNLMPRTDLQFIAIYFDHTSGSGKRGVRAVTVQRVLARGDNHQTVRVGAIGEQKVAKIMDGFLHRFQPLNMQHAPDSRFNYAVTLDVDSSLQLSLMNIIYCVKQKYPEIMLESPSQDEVLAAAQSVLGNRPAAGSFQTSPPRRRQQALLSSFQRKETSAATGLATYFALKITDPTALLAQIDTLLPSGDHFIWKKMITSASSPTLVFLRREKAVAHRALWDALSTMITAEGVDKLTADVVIRGIAWTETCVWAAAYIEWHANPINELLPLRGVLFPIVLGSTGDVAETDLGVGAALEEKFQSSSSYEFGEELRISGLRVHAGM
ncbi:tRNA ligase kinase domain-containing protein [Myxozyma melibiosi]|uniref:tRNA ligase kinase domain-containing protein n=1 Tax=Myxozyma melibiosi TaxID=54550 RepID=A0ABR1F233_9ASCO